MPNPNLRCVHHVGDVPPGEVIPGHALDPVGHRRLVRMGVAKETDREATADLPPLSLTVARPAGDPAAH